MKRFVAWICALMLTVGCIGDLTPVARAADEAAAPRTVEGSVTYYVSTSGKGGNDGSQANPFPGLDAVPWDRLLPGDSVLLKKGDTFPGMIRMVDVHGTADDPIIIGAYGDGSDAPVIETRGQGIWLPETGNGNGYDPGKYVSSGVTLYDCSYITVKDLTIVNVPDTMKTSFTCVDGTDRSGDKMTYSGIGVAADGVGAAEGITLTNITVRGNSEVQTVKTDTSTNIVTTGVTKDATAAPRNFTDTTSTYYVSSRSGSDSNDGLSPENAFYSLHKINELNLQPGAKVYLECGSVFENQYLHIEGGGSNPQPIIIDAYGGGDAPLINTNGEGVWYQNYRKNLDSTNHLVHGYVSSCVLLYDVPYVEVRNIAMTNGGTYGQTVNSFPYIGENQVDGGTVPGETGYNANGNTVGCYQWGGKMCRTGVAGVAQNKGTVTHTVLRNLDIENVYGNVYVKHMNNGGIYFTTARPLGDTGIPKYDDLVIEGCYLKRVSRWGIAAVQTSYWQELSPNGVQAIPDDACRTYGATNVYIGHNYLEEVGEDPITAMHAFEPFVEYNVAYRGGREGSGSAYHNGTAIMGNKSSFSAGIWPWKCKTALFEHNECYSMLNSQDDNGDAQAWDADSGDSTIYQYNYSSGNTGGCIMYCQGDAYNSVFRYNISFDDGSHGNRKVGAIDMPGAPNGQLYNNLFLLKDGLRCYYRAGSPAVQVWNNIYYNLGSDQSFDAKWDDSGVTYNNNVYCGFGAAPSNDSNAITMTKSETLFADPTFADAPRVPKAMDKVGTGDVNGVRSWTHNWASDFNMFKLADGVSDKVVNKAADIGYTGLNQDANFGVPRVDNDTDFYGNPLDNVHDIGAFDTLTTGSVDSSKCELVSSLYELRGSNNTELQVPLGTNLSPTVETFLKGLTVSAGATVGVYSGDTKQADNTKITDTMTVKVVAEDGTTSKTYTIAGKKAYNSQTDWVDNQQGNVWFYQGENNGVFTNQSSMGSTYKDWTGAAGSVEQNQAVGDISNSRGAGFTFRAPVSGTVTVSFSHKVANDNAGKASTTGVVTGSIRKREAHTGSNMWQTYLRTYRNAEEMTEKAIMIPMTSIEPIPVASYTITVAQGDTLSFMVRNENKDDSVTRHTNYGVYFNPIITYEDVAFNEPDDQKAPSVPLGLRARNVTDTTADLVWDASTDNVGVTGYKVKVGANAEETVTGTAKSLAGLTADTQYTVTVKAVDAAGNESAAASVTFRTAKTVVVDNTPPDAPTGGTVVSTTSDTATISWTASTDDIGVDHYEVTVGGQTVIVRNATKVTLTGLTAATGYTASVKAVDAAGKKSAALDIAITTAAATTPPALVKPAEGYVMKLSSTSAEIRWRTSDGADGYEVKLGETGAAEKVGDVNRHTFSGLTMGTQYTAYVCACRGAETSTDWLAIPFTTSAVYNSFEDWVGTDTQGTVWRYQHQDDTGAIVDHETWDSQYSCWGMGAPTYKSVERNQACGSVKSGQGSGFTFIAPKTGTVQVRFFYYADGSTTPQEDTVKRRSNAEQEIQPYIRLYINGKELTKKAITVNKDATAQSVEPITVALKENEKLSILAWNGGDYASWGSGNCGIYFNPVITYLSDSYVPEAESAGINKTTATIYTNTNAEIGPHTVQLAVESIQPATANPQITWSIRPEDTGVVSVDDGLVTAVGNGRALVTATVSSDYGDIPLTCTVTVNTRMESITVKKGSTAIGSGPITVYVNANETDHSVNLTAEPTPANPTHPNLNWNTVEGAEYQGVISLVKNANGGSATITAGTDVDDVGLAKVKVASADHPDTYTEFTVRVVRKLVNNVSITPAAPKFGQTLTVNTSQLQMTQAGMNGLSYQWHRTKGDTTEDIGTNSRTYVLQAADIGAVISVTVTANPATYYEGERTASTSAVAQADGGSIAASARVENCSAANNDGKITGLIGSFKHEYRVKTTSEGGWTPVADGAEQITDLVPGTYQVRRAETATHTAGPASDFTVLSFEQSADTYAITIGALENGEVTPSAWYAKANTEITLTIEPAEGYQLVANSLTVYKTGEEATTVDVEDGKFTMPAYPVTVTARFEKQKFTLGHELEHINCDQGTNNHEVAYGDPFTINLTAQEGYTMPDAVTVKTEDDEEFEGYQYNRADDGHAAIVFDRGITQNLIITGAGVVKSYTVNYNIRNLNAPETDAPRTVEHKAAYTGKLVADEGYALPKNDEHEKVLMTMGGADFTDFTYDPENGTIDIAADKITGNLVITAVGMDTSVDPVLVSGVRLSQTSASVTVGSTITLTATVLPEEATVKLVGWSSSAPAVAGVDEDGVVTALAEGEATITVTTLDGGLTAECTVTVTEATSGGGNTTVAPITGGGSDTSTTTTTNPDGTVTTTVTDKKTGTVTETTEKPDGTVETKETLADGTVTETTEKPDGSSEVVETKPDGTVTETSTDADGAKVEKVTTPDEDVTITVTDKDGEELAKVEIPAVIPEPENRFVDVPEGHWADEAIHNMAALDVVRGVGNNTYNRNGDMKRGDLALMLSRMSSSEENSYELAFADVPASKYYASGVAWAAKTGVVTGRSADTFDPENTITREELAVMLYRYAKLLKLDSEASGDALDAFTDGGDTHGWAEEGMAWCVKNGILQGKGNGVLDPRTNVTRAEVAVMLQRFVDLLK